MKQLSHILSSVPNCKIFGNTRQPISNLCLDSRMAKKGDCFVAIKGHEQDGHIYIGAAISRGVVAVVCENLPDEMPGGITFVVVEDAAAAAGYMASEFYNNPSHHMKVVGITGTNGKTTVATLLFQLFEELGYPSGLISTVQNHIHKVTVTATHTTPDAITIQQLLHEMYEAGCAFVFMEVSSHALHQRRIAGIQFSGGVFTNITHDHLDYHKTFDEYIRVKKSFFDHLPKQSFALTNLDDKRGKVILQNCKAQKSTYALRHPADYKGSVLENELTGLLMLINGKEAHFRLTGIFNAYNLLAVFGVAYQLNMNAEEVLQTMSALTGAAGRMETFISTKEHIVGIVDYAHTPDALLNVLSTIKQMRTKDQQIISVLGCGGDRDVSKRSLMAQVAVEHSDHCVFTSDNPRSEDPEAILNDMEADLSLSQKRKILRIANRKEAIKTACMLAKSGDVLLVAGKGHETYQEINGVKYDFDDRKVLNDTFQLLDK